MFRGRLWGIGADLDYWTAQRRGEVEDAERRAVELLRRNTDPVRFGLYCLTGEIAAMGNVTKRTYLVRKHGGVVEIEDGRRVAGWCIHLHEWMHVPDTDNVIALRNVIEGEELAFIRTGHRNRAMVGLQSYGEGEPERPVGARNLAAEPFVPDSAFDLPGGIPALLGTEELLKEGPLLNDWEGASFRPRERARGFEEMPGTRDPLHGSRLEDGRNDEILRGEPRAELYHFHEEIQRAIRFGNWFIVESHPLPEDHGFLGFRVKDGNRPILGRPERTEPKQNGGVGAYVTAADIQCQTANQYPNPPLDYGDNLRREIEREVAAELARGGRAPVNYAIDRLDATILRRNAAGQYCVA